MKKNAKNGYEALERLKSTEEGKALEAILQGGFLTVVSDVWRDGDLRYLLTASEDGITLNSYQRMLLGGHGWIQVTSTLANTIEVPGEVWREFVDRARIKALKEQKERAKLIDEFAVSSGAGIVEGAIVKR